MGERLHLRSLLIAAAAHTILSLSPTTVSLGTLSIYPVSLGTLNLIPSKGDGAEDALIARRVLEAAPPRILLDTAEKYASGRCESALGAASVKTGIDIGGGEGNEDRPGPFVATKFTPGMMRTGADSVVSACRESASRLGVDRIDLYQIHYADVVQPLSYFGIENVKDELYWDGLAECYHSGLAANVGVCNYGPTMVRRAHEALAKRGVPLASNQINFNLMRFRSSRDTKDACDELGIKILAYHPLGGGYLTDKYDLSDENTLPTKSQYSMHRVRYFLKGTEPLRESLRKIGAERGKTCAQIAINWVRFNFQPHFSSDMLLFLWKIFNLVPAALFQT